jgi:hypothetical protein
MPLAAAALLASGCAAVPPPPTEPAAATLINPAATATPLPLPAGAAHWARITAPIALYSDPLLAQVLVAATHPHEIAQAARWLDRRPRARLGYELGPGLQRQHWDASVKSLAALPDVLHMMSAHPRWLHQLGSAFRSHPEAVMDSIQQLRRSALEYDVLHSTREQQVTDDGVVVSIRPARPDTIYVSYYRPEFVYGRWPWPRTPPYSFEPSEHVVFGGAPIAFGVPLNVTALPWRWYRWHWRGHRLEVLAAG